MINPEDGTMISRRAEAGWLLHGFANGDIGMGLFRFNPDLSEFGDFYRNYTIPRDTIPPRSYQNDDNYGYFVGNYGFSYNQSPTAIRSPKGVQFSFFEMGIAPIANDVSVIRNFIPTYNYQTAGYNYETVIGTRHGETAELLEDHSIFFTAAWSNLYGNNPYSIRMMQIHPDANDVLINAGPTVYSGYGGTFFYATKLNSDLFIGVLSYADSNHIYVSGYEPPVGYFYPTKLSFDLIRKFDYQGNLVGTYKTEEFEVKPNVNRIPTLQYKKRDVTRIAGYQDKIYCVKRTGAFAQILGTSIWNDEDKIYLVCLDSNLSEVWSVPYHHINGLTVNRHGIFVTGYRGYSKFDFDGNLLWEFGGTEMSESQYLGWQNYDPTHEIVYGDGIYDTEWLTAACFSHNDTVYVCGHPTKYLPPHQSEHAPIYGSVYRNYPNV